jgi:hypothetical protein
MTADKPTPIVVDLPTSMKMRGTKIEIFPSKEKAVQLDLWCRRTTHLWNLLRDLQRAAYSGENLYSGLGWRQMWVRILKDDYVEAELVYREGKRTKDKNVRGALIPGKVLNEPGIGREEERAALKAELKELEQAGRKKTREFKDLKERIKKIAPRPEPVDPAYVDKILWHWRPNGLPLEEDQFFRMLGGVRKKLSRDGAQARPLILAWLKQKKLSDRGETVMAWLVEHSGSSDSQALNAQALDIAAESAKKIAKANRPGIFIPVLTMQKIMARLKQIPQTRWIGDLPSHAAQYVVKDLDKAIATMISERRKAAAGEPSRKAGFPRRKLTHASEGSVYFPNTTVWWNLLANKVRLPNGINRVFIDPDALRKMRQEALEAKAERKFVRGVQLGMIGARLWCRGTRWFLSVQWERRIRQLPFTGHRAGVKINASVPITVYQSGRPIKEYPMPPVDAKLAADHKTACKALSRCLEDQKKREQKLTRRKQWQRKRAAEAGKEVKAALPVRLTRSRGFYEAKEEIARLEMKDQDHRDRFIHESTTEIVRRFDAIAVQKMDVSEMMKKPDAKRQRHHDRRRKRHEGKLRRQISLKIARKMMRRAAMARIVSVLQYKFTDLRGEASFQEIDKHDVNASACSRCGTIHVEWQDGRKIVRCSAILPDGSVCGNVLDRAANAARMSERELSRRRKTA